MDNVCHSLAGAVLAECGFARRSRFATAAMVLAANIPDLDVAYIFGGELSGLESRRGWTHSLPALALWPFVVVGCVLTWQRFVKLQPPASAPPVVLRALLLGSAIAVVSHPFLDWMNEYGVRVLMPWSERWFYGDTLFIVDLVLLLLFGTGWWLARLRRRLGEPRSVWPARSAVALALLYIVVMKVQSERSKAAIQATLGVSGDPRRLVIEPRPVSVRTRSALIVTDSGYVVRTVHAGLRVSVGPVTEFVPTRAQEPLSRAAAATDDYRRFARWSRFPYFVPAPDGDSSVVFVADARYARGTATTWAGTRIRVSRGP